MGGRCRRGDSTDALNYQRIAVPTSTDPKTNAAQPGGASTHDAKHVETEPAFRVTLRSR